MPETGHNLADPILTYWRTHGEVAGLGYPVSEAFDEFDVLTLQTHRVQYFERSRLEITKDAGGKDAVQLGALGIEKYKQRYGTVPNP